MSNVHAIIYLLFSIFHRLPRGTPLSPTRPPYDQFPYSLASPTGAYTRGLRRMPAPPPLTYKFVGMASYAPTYFYELLDDEVESDGSNIGDVAPGHRPSRECAMADTLGQPLVVAESLQTHTHLDPRVGPLRGHGSTARSYDKGGRTSSHLRRRARRSTLRPTRVTRRAAPGVAPARSSATSLTVGTIPHSSLGLARTSPLQQCFCVAFQSLSTPRSRQSTGTSGCW